MAKLKDGFYKLTAEAVGSNSYMLLAGGGSKALSDFVTDLGTNGNYVTWTKNGTVNNLTVPYATKSNKLYQNEDLRNENTLPYASADYNKSISAPFLRYNSVDGLNDGGTYHTSIIITPWSDHTGGSAHNIGLTNNGNVWIRSGTTEWSVWKKVAFFDEIPTKVSQLTNDSGYLTSTNLTNYVTLNSNLTITGSKTFSTQLKFTVAQGTAPFTVTSKTLVTNLNADLLDGRDSSDYVAYKNKSINYTEGWYRIAETSVDVGNNIGIFYIYSSGPGYHTNVILGASISYTSIPTLNLLNMTQYSTMSISKARIVYNNSTYAKLKAYLDVYIPLTLTSSDGSAKSIQIFVKFVGHKWSLTPIEAATVENTHTTKEISFAKNTIISDYFLGDLIGSASALTTTRKLWGLDFNGTQNVTGNMNGVGTINNRLLLDGSGNAQVHITGVTANTDYIKLQIDGGSSSNRNLVLLTDGGFVGIGTDSPLYKLHVAGTTSTNLLFIGGLSHPMIIGNGSLLSLGAANSNSKASVVLDLNTDSFRINSVSTATSLGTATYPWANIYGSTITIKNYKNFINGDISYPNVDDSYKMGTDLGLISFIGDNGNDTGLGITWSFNTISAHAGIYTKLSGIYGSKMYFATTNAFSHGPKAALEIDHEGNIKALRGGFKGNLTGNAASSTITGDGTMTIIPLLHNEINFGGTNNSLKIYFGYRATDSKPIPTSFIFGGSDGSASLSASKFIKSGGTAALLLRADGNVATFNWSGQSGQPTWLWGGDTQHTYYVYNPANFSVNYATSAGNADTLDGEHGSRYTLTLGGPNYVTITVEGDAATYYPVIIKSVSNKYPMLFVNISREFSETAPDSWNNSTHKGGLTLTLLWNGSRYWDGNGSGQTCYCVYVYESYCTMVGGLGNSTAGKVVWLRGGGAVYHIHAMNGTSVTADVHTSTYTDSAKLSFAPRTTVESYDVRWPGYSYGADKLGSSTIGGIYLPIYLSSGAATAGTSYAKAIKAITRSGTTFTYTCIDGTTGTFTQLDSNTTYPVYFKNITTGFKDAFRTQTKGDANSGNYISAIRCDTASIENAPIYSSGIAFGMSDTHGYLYTSYNSAIAYIGGGNVNKLNWIKQIAFRETTLSGYGITDAVTLNTQQTISGLKTFESNSSTTGVSLILKNKGWYPGMSTAIDFYNGNAYTVPNARIETKMVGSGYSGGTLIFYTQTKHASTNPNPNGLTERMRIDDNDTIIFESNLHTKKLITLTDNNSYIKSSSGNVIVGAGTSSVFTGGFESTSIIVGNSYIPTIIRTSANDLYHYRGDTSTRYSILDTGNSSVSGGGSTWGSSITINLGGTSKTLTIPSKPSYSWTDISNKPVYSWSGSSPLDIILANYGTMATNLFISAYLAHGSGSIAMGYKISGYESTPYGGWFGATYSSPWFIGASAGTWTLLNIITDTNYTSYTVKKDGTGASGKWGINITGNAATATKLQTARKIWGQSFDGSGNVDGLFTLTNTGGNGKPFKIGWLNDATENPVLNMWSYDYSLGGFSDMCLGVSSDVVSQGSLYFNSSTKQWGIGTASPTQKLEVNGNIKATSFIGKLNGSLVGGAKGNIVYQSATDTTAFLANPSTNGYVLKFNTSTGLPYWASDNNTTYTLPLAASGTRGGILIGYSESGKNYAVKLSSEKAYVYVPWTDIKVNVTLATTTKAYLLGVSTTPTSTTLALTTVSDTGVYLDTTAGSLTATNFKGHLIGTISGSYTANGGQQNPNYFGKNKVGFLMMNTTVNNNSSCKDWMIMDCYSGSDVGGAVAFGVNRQSLGAYIMRSTSERTSWTESAELLGTHNYSNYALALSGGTLSGDLTLLNLYVNYMITSSKPSGALYNPWSIHMDDYLWIQSATANGTNVKGKIALSGKGAESLTELFLKADLTKIHNTILFNKLSVPTTSGGSTYGPGANGQVLKSNGSTVYWANDNNSYGYIGTTAVQSSSKAQSLTGIIDITASGNIIASGEITAYSDRRLKSNIKPLENRGYIQPMTYIKDNKECIGFIAQDVLEKYPELVNDNSEYLSLNYLQYVAVLQALIIELEKRIKELENGTRKL